ncbi:MAG TPA: Verru_Chthon cassette protein A, partial [Candidatus Saccharimonadia bacterium]|nr:Verru_Chthon cassette protein A [Candidatus Saccharimonadia bacterium]
MKELHLPYRSTRDGTALLPALIIIGMVTVIVVLFFSMSTVQMRSSSSHVAVHDVSTLQDMAVNAAIGQMRMGTTENNALWISQPGAVRTYDSSNGAASRVYKLYSAREMVVNATALTNASALNLENDVPADWNTHAGVYADLNEPAMDGAGDLIFPVVDPRAMDMAVPSYPDSRTPEGFQYSKQLAVSSTSINGVNAPGGPSSAQRLPMPVRWIYVLQDGGMGVMDDSTPPRFTPFAGQSNASSANPIVGRYAFWTDDESAKVNINTASEAIFWDTPRCATSREVEFATTPPVRNEVQRFGGHPATTCLSTVFYPGERLVPGSTEMNRKLENIYAITPRVNADGGIVRANNQPVTFDTDRLYSSVDELLLDDPSDTGSGAIPFNK